MPKNVFTTQPPANAVLLNFIKVQKRLITTYGSISEIIDELVDSLEKRITKIDMKDKHIYETFQIFGLQFLHNPEVEVIAYGTLVGIPKDQAPQAETPKKLKKNPKPAFGKKASTESGKRRLCGPGVAVTSSQTSEPKPQTKKDPSGSFFNNQHNIRERLDLLPNQMYT